MAGTLSYTSVIFPQYEKIQTNNFKACGNREIKIRLYSNKVFYNTLHVFYTTYAS